MTTSSRRPHSGRLRRALATTAATVVLSIGATVASQAAPAVAAETTIGTASAQRSATSTAAPASTSMVDLVTQPATATVAAAAWTWWDQTVAFVGCIFGVGVPIGLAWAIATNPAWLAFFMGRGPLPASAGGAAYGYWNWVRSTCAYALF